MLKTSGSDYIPVVILKKRESELASILAELFIISLKESCFLVWWKVSPVVSIFKNDGESSVAKNSCFVSLLSLVSKVLKNL